MTDCPRIAFLEAVCGACAALNWIGARHLWGARSFVRGGFFDVREPGSLPPGYPGRYLAPALFKQKLFPAGATFLLFGWLAETVTRKVRLRWGGAPPH